MKKLLILSVLVTFGLTYSWAYSPITGHYESLSSHQTFEISKTRNGIVVKGQYDRNGTLFIKNHNGKFKSKRGDQLIIRNKKEVELKRRGRHSTILKRVEHRHNRYEGRRDNKFKNYYGEKSWQQSHSNHLNLEGRWHEDSHGRKHQDIKIVEKHRGISILQNHCDEDFYSLARSWDRVNVFENRRGDTFSYFRNGDLVWTSANGHKEKHYHRY